MNTLLQQRVRPDLYLGMGDVDMDGARIWLENHPCRLCGVYLESLAGAYTRGVRFGLVQIGMGFFTSPGVSPLSSPWVDALGTEWQWDDADCRAVSRPARDMDMDQRDVSEMPDKDFTAFVQGMLDAAEACGWGVANLAASCSAP